jgi:hypothetical protein
VDTNYLVTILVITLALGMGATISRFTTANMVLLHIRQGFAADANSQALASMPSMMCAFGSALRMFVEVCQIPGSEAKGIELSLERGAGQTPEVSRDHFGTVVHRICT